MAAVIALGGVAVLGSAAHAQPGQTAPLPPPPPPAPMGGPMGPVGGPGVPPPYMYQPMQPVALTPEEQELLEDGEISLGAQIGGGFLGFYFGFGTGQAVQGRWRDTGWIFTFGELGSIAAIVAGFAQGYHPCVIDWDCRYNGNGRMLAVLGIIGWAGFRFGGTIEAFVAPSGHNRRVRALKRRLGILAHAPRVVPYAAPTEAGGGIAGFSLAF